MRVLIVEDEPTLRNIMARLVRRVFEEPEVLTTNTADSAIELLKESVFSGEFDVVLCDYNLLGGRTGGDVLDWIQEHLSRLEKRFIFLSSDAAIQTRGVPFFDKPCDIPTLKQALLKLVQPEA